MYYMLHVPHMYCREPSSPNDLEVAHQRKASTDYSPEPPTVQAQTWKLPISAKMNIGPRRCMTASMFTVGKRRPSVPTSSQLQRTAHSSRHSECSGKYFSSIAMCSFAAGSIAITTGIGPLVRQFTAREHVRDCTSNGNSSSSIGSRKVPQ